MFSTLNDSGEARTRRGLAFFCGLFSQALMIGIMVLLGIWFADEVPVPNRHYSVTWIPAFPSRVRPALKPPREVARVIVPKVKMPEKPKIVAPLLAYLEIPKIRPTILVAHVTEPPQPARTLALPGPPPKEHIVVHTGLFSAGGEPVTTKRPAAEVQTGGFGNPQGLPGLAQRGNPGNVPKLGSFGLPVGPGRGNGTGGSHGIQGVVATAGFGSGVAGNGRAGGGEGWQPSVTLGGFAKPNPVAPSATAAVYMSTPVGFQPVDIISKPRPVYTQEARELGIQGEVTLSVLFEASGAIRVISVVKSLGHGLDQAAVQAAAQIRFKPAQRDGKPADFPAILRIEFRLADQST